jgi:hypothetical protein
MRRNYTCRKGEKHRIRKRTGPITVAAHGKRRRLCRTYTDTEWDTQLLHKLSDATGHPVNILRTMVKNLSSKIDINVEELHGQRRRELGLK